MSFSVPNSADQRVFNQFSIASRNAVLRPVWHCLYLHAEHVPAPAVWNAGNEIRYEMRKYVNPLLEQRWQDGQVAA